MNKIRLFFTTNIFLLIFFNLLNASDTPEKITQMQIKSIQEQLKVKTEEQAVIKEQKNKVQDGIIHLDTPGIGSEKEKLTNLEIEHFGYSFFNSKGSRLVYNNQPPPPSYLVGIGDEIIIEIWGETQLRSNHIIDQYGKIYIDKIGQVQLAGLTLTDIEEKLLSKFQNVFSSLKGSQPSATLDVSIGKLKSINVTILGESSAPAIHAIHPFSTIITGLLQIGGIGKNGSLRDIQLIRNGKIHTTLDFYQFLLKGKNHDDLRLINGDIIFIPIRNSTISVKGEVIRGAVYELLPNETLDDLIHYAGGFKISAMNKILVHRFYNMEEINALHPHDETFFIDYIHEKDFVLKNGDSIEVYSIAESVNEVYVYGQVKKPGRYAFDTNMKLLDVLILAGGFNDSTYLKTIFLEKAEIIRNHPQEEYPEIIEFNVRELLSGESRENIELRNWDIILIRQNPLFTLPGKVWMLGEVNMPGIYTIQNRDETLQDIISRANGFSDKAFQFGLQLKRQGQQVALDDFNIIVADGDSLMVPKHPGIVEVKGEVYQPGLIQFQKHKSLQDYIEGAGGFTMDANRHHITVVHPNGEVEIKKILTSPKVREGSTIIIQKKEEAEPFDLTDFATNFASIVTSLATIFLISGN